MTDVDLKLPYLHPERMASGRTRYRVNKDGRKTTIRGEPGSDEFMAAYKAAMDGDGAERTKQTRAGKTGSIEWLVKLYLANLRSLVTRDERAPETLKQRVSLLEPFATAHGHRSAAMMGAREIKLLLRAYDDRPGARDNFHKALKSLFAFAVEEEHLDTNVAALVKRQRPKSKGFTPWKAADLRAFIETHPHGTTAHLAVTLLTFTGVRRGDLVRIDRSMISNGWLELDQSKTAEPLSIPVLPQLQRAIDGPAAGEAVLLLNAYGEPFSKAGFGARMRKWCDDAGLDGLTAHGVRKGLGALLGELGCSQLEIASVLGHTDPKSSSTYTESARRRVMADTAMKRVAHLEWD